MVALTFALGTAAFATLGGFGPTERADSAPTIVTDVVPTTAAANAASTVATAPATAATASPTAGDQRTGAATAAAPATTAATPTTAAAATTAPTTSAAPSTTAAPTTTAAGTRPTLYTVSGQLIPSYYSVPSKWWTRSIPAYPAGTWAKCKLEDEGWACEK